ncbi:MAG: TonB-dependent receptor, partial [Candidatus Omnitrophota bacterium]
ITKDAGDTPVPKGSFTHSTAEHRTLKDSFDLSGKIGEAGYYLFVSYMSSGGIRAKADTGEIKHFSKVSFPLSDSAEVTSSFGYYLGDINSGQYPGGTYSDRTDGNKFVRIGLDVDFGNGATLNNAFKSFRQDIVTRYFDSVDDEEPSDIVRSQDKYYGLELKSLVRLRDEDTLLIGADFDWHILKSTYIADSKSINLQAPYANYTLRLNDWDWILGARFDNNSEYGNQFSPSLGVVYRIPAARETSIRAAVSRAFNAPPLLWRFNDYSFSWDEYPYYVIPNPDLKPERAWAYEMGIESELIDNLRAKLSLYRADVKDALAQVMEDSKIYYKNFQKFRRQGAEFQVKVRLNSCLAISGSAAFNDVEDRATRKTVQGIGVARQSFNIGIEYKNENGFSCILRSYYNYWNQVADFEPNDRKFISDLKISQEIKGMRGLDLELFLNIYNITNSRYWADYYFPIPRRYFEGGFTVKW